MADVLVEVQQGRIGFRHKFRWRRTDWAIFLGGAAVVGIGLAVGPFLMRPASKQGNQHANVVPGGGQADKVSEPDQPFAVSELKVVDPSPASAAQSELDSLSGMLDALEATPFPEKVFGALEPPEKDPSEAQPHDGAADNEGNDANH